MRHRYLSTLSATAVALVVVAFAGCHGREVGSLDQIEVVKYRYSIEDSGDVVRVVGLARNIGELPTPEAEIIATLRSRTGSFKGQNRVDLPALEPGAEHQFGLAIESHGSVESVDIAVVEPGTVVEEGGEGAPDSAAADDTPDDSDEEGGQDDT